MPKRYPEPDSNVLISDLKQQKPEDFISRWYLEYVPFIFNGDIYASISWRRKIALMLGVSPFDVIVVGSAALGKSLNPDKHFTDFSSESDIDVAVVSNYYFDLAWHWMRTLGARRYRLPASAQEWIKQHENHLVYYGAIATDQLLQYMPFGPDWAIKLVKIGSDPPVEGREINVRLYRDHISLHDYLFQSVRKLKIRIQPTEEENIE